MDYEDKICEFKTYVKQTMDLLVDAYKWKVMSEDAENEDISMKYKQVSDTLFGLYMTEHNNSVDKFRKDWE